MFSTGSRFVCLHCHLPTLAYFINKNAKTIIQITQEKLDCETLFRPGHEISRWSTSCQHLLLFTGLDKPPLCNSIRLSPPLSAGQSADGRVTDGGVEPDGIPGVGRAGGAAGRAEPSPVARSPIWARPADVGAPQPLQSRGWARGVVRWVTPAGSTLFPPALAVLRPLQNYLNSSPQ